jgi:outer membrane protein assembly factor BamB
MALLRFVFLVPLVALFSAASLGCSSDSSGTGAGGESQGEDEAPPSTVTTWAPDGPRTVGDYDYSVIPEPNAFHTMHVGANNSDNVWVALAPQLELDWVEETSFYVPEGPTYDNAGNLYFSPFNPQEDVSLVSLDAETGARNWAIEAGGARAGSGATLILNDPDNPGEQLIYHVTYIEAMALRPDGTELWRVPTGLTLPPVVEGVREVTHSFGFNYHPEADALVALMMSGEMLAFDRVTGTLLASEQIPGSPAVSEFVTVPQFVIDQSDALTDEVFGKTESGLSIFSVIIDVIFGGGSVVTNYFAIEPNSGVIYVAATDEDEADGSADGLSERGALYAYDLVESGAGLGFTLRNTLSFEGGTGSTPTVSEDGSRVFVSDNLGNVIALDANLETVWQFALDDPVAASIAVSPDNSEVYAVTRKDVYKLIDQGDSASLSWVATLDAFADDPDIEIEFQALTPTITANGLAISVGGGRPVGESEVMLKVGIGLLDRITGRLRSFTLGREESIAITSVTPTGSICTANSPVRRVSGRALFPEIAEPIVGGISCYKPVRNDLLARDATCAAGLRARNAGAIADGNPRSAAEDIRQIQVLVAQSSAAIDRAEDDGDLDSDTTSNLRGELDGVAESLSPETLLAAANTLIRTCRALDAP